VTGRSGLDRTNFHPGIAVQRNWSGEAVALADDGLDETGFLRVIAESHADLADRGIDAVIDIDEDVLAPEAGRDFLSGDEFPVTADQQDQQLHGEFLQPQDAVTPLQPVPGLVKGEVAEMEFLGRKDL
jgi:hypothetical protein